MTTSGLRQRRSTWRRRQWKYCAGVVGTDDLNVVLRGQGQEAFEAGAGMFRALSFKTVRQQQDQPAEPVPFVFRAGDELINDDLGGVEKSPNCASQQIKPSGQSRL